MINENYCISISSKSVFLSQRRGQIFIFFLKVNDDNQQILYLKSRVVLNIIIVNNLQQLKLSMSNFIDFFIKIDGHDGVQYPISLKVLHSQTFIEQKMLVSLCSKTILFKCNEKDSPCTINRNCKMIPKYSSNQNGEYCLDQLTINLSNCYLTFSSEKIEQLSKVYNKLKLLISHKGFNDYFKPIKRLGKGAFATVYLIQHKTSKERFAAKVFSRQGQKLEFKGQQALQNEIKTLRFLSHPNIIKYEGVYETDNLIYLVTQYLSGGTLDEFMRNRFNLTGEVVLNIIKEMLLTLEYLETNNILHRDLKPENILLRQSDSKWVLADFGLSAFTNQNHIYDKCGTLGYMAPQFFCENIEERKISHALNVCDMYSLGVIAYYIIFGNLPFRVETQSMFDRKIVWDAWKRTQCEEIHPEILNFLKGLLQSNPIKRWTWKKAYESPFLNNSTVKQVWNTYSKQKIDQRYQKILKMANIN